MNEIDIIQALNEIDDNLIDKANPKRNKEKYLKLIPVAACFVLVCLTINFFQSPKPAPTPTGTHVAPIPESTTPASEAGKTEIVIVPESESIRTEEGATEIITEIINKEAFENYSFPLKYEYLKFNSKTYSRQPSEAIPEKYIGEKITVATVESFYEIEHEVMKAEVPVHKIKGISTDCAVAVKDEETGKYYVFVYPLYKFSSLEEMENKLNLKKSTSFYYAIYEEKDVALTRYINLDSEKIMSILFDNTDIKAVNKPEKKAFFDLCMYMDTPCLSGEKDRYSISVSAEGLLDVFIFDEHQYFSISKSKASKLIKYITENYNGERKVFVTSNEEYFSPGFDGFGPIETEVVTEVISNSRFPQN